MPSDHESRADSELVDAFRSGDDDAFAQLYRRHRDRVFRLALSVTCDREIAADVTQDVFLRLPGRIGSFEGRAKFTTWLHRVVVNACHDVLRKKIPDPVADIPETAALATDSPASEVVDRLTVIRALSQVPEDFRVVLVLHDLYDHRYEEIAGIVGVPIGTVKSRLARGRLRLSELLCEDAVDSESVGSGNKPVPSERRTSWTDP